jgi:hypothetical protein
MKLLGLNLGNFFKESTDESAKRLVLIMAGISLSISVIVYVISGFYVPINSEILWALTIPLSAMAGVSYASVEKERLRLQNAKTKEAKDE